MAAASRNENGSLPSETRTRTLTGLIAAEVVHDSCRYDVSGLKLIQFGTKFINNTH